MDSSNAISSRLLNGSAVRIRNLSRKPGRVTRVQAAMTATCRACGEPCAVEQWTAGDGAYACSLGCLERGLL
jgi:hypothetical protein